MLTGSILRGGAPWLTGLIVLIGTSQLWAAVRVAIVGDGGNSTDADLLVARLTVTEGIELVERQEIALVLKEQALLRRGLVDASQALQLGRLLSADLLVVLEMSGTPQSGAVIFDGKSGLRYEHQQLPASTEKAVACVDQLVQSALRKRERGTRGRLVGLLGVRSADLPRRDDGLCAALEVLLERGLTRSPEIAVLERRRLEYWNRERELVPEQARELFGAIQVLELELSRHERTGLRASARVTRPDGTLITTASATNVDGDLPRLADDLIRELTGQKNGTPEISSSDRAQESIRFAREAAHQFQHDQFADAVRLAEAARALDPSSNSIAEQLSSYLLKHSIVLFSPSEATVTRGDDAGWARTPVSDETMRRLLTQAHRSLEIQGPQSRRALSHLVYCRSLGMLCDRLRAVAVVGTPDPQVHDEICEFLDTCVQIGLSGAAQRARMAAQDPEFLDAYTTSLGSEVALITSAARDTETYCRALHTILAEWLQTTRTWKPEHNSTDGGDAVVMLLRSFVIPPRWPRTIDPVEYARSLSTQFIPMEHHARPLVGLYGTFGHLRSRMLLNQISEADGHDEFIKTFRARVQSLIHHPEPWHPSRTRTAAFEAWRMAIEELPGPTAAAFRRRETAALCDLMLGRRELHYKSLQLAFHNLEPRESYHLIRQTRAVTQDPQWSRDEPDAVRILSLLKSTEQQILKDHPEFETHRPATAWSRAIRLYDASEHRDLSDLLIGRLQGDSLTVVFLQFLDGQAGLRLGSLGPDRPLERLGWVGLGIDEKSVPAYRRRDFATSIVCEKQEIVVGLDGSGIAWFPKDGEPRHGDSHRGLPSDRISGVALLDGVIYAGSSEGSLFTWNPRTDRVEVLASSRRREKRSPFDDGPSFRVPLLVADAERGRIVFIVGTGLWQYTPADGVFLKRGDLHAAARGRSIPKLDGTSIRFAGPVRDQRVLVANAFRVMELDLRTDAVRELHYPEIGIFPIEPPLAVQGEELWTGGSFARLTLGTQDYSHWPKPTDDAGATPFRASQLLEPAHEGRGLYAGNAGTVWRLDRQIENE